jgi:hypothetical protein
MYYGVVSPFALSVSKGDMSCFDTLRALGIDSPPFTGEYLTYEGADKGKNRILFFTSIRNLFTCMSSLYSGDYGDDYTQLVSLSNSYPLSKNPRRSIADT